MKKLYRLSTLLPLVLLLILAACTTPEIDPEQLGQLADDAGTIAADASAALTAEADTINQAASTIVAELTPRAEEDQPEAEATVEPLVVEEAEDEDGEMEDEDAMATDEAAQPAEEDAEGEDADATDEAAQPAEEDDEGDESEVSATATPAADDEDEDDTAAATGVSIGVRSSEQFGDYLVDGDGMSLYVFLDDEQGIESSACRDRCANAWPPLTTDGEPQAADSAVNADMLGTFEREDGTQQVTYNGWPLYYYAPDQQPGDTLGQDIESFGAEWYLVSPDGTALRAED